MLKLNLSRSKKYKNKLLFELKKENNVINK